MKLYVPRKLRGSWHFDSNKYDYDYDISPYPEIRSDLKIILTILIESQLLIPKLLDGKNQKLEYKNIDDLISLIEKDNYLQTCFEFDISGDTVIYTEKGEEIHSSIFCLQSFRTFQQSFVLSTKSDIWMPMSFDENSHSYIWNLERYNLNNHRLSSVLEKINKSLGWENENLLQKEFNERGSLQIGYDIFLSQEVLIREYKENPNPDFNINEYLAKMEV
ncbi:hypothetical protein ACHRVK_14625 [Flavobacterium plurextorum]|uniref:Uncharacterized protein n=1 Tax=Flavobacterium plurextorum TaxID=1114867 RepID=A0ABX4CU07_9FLAO|nr:MULTISPECIES: hypothetical protein [Flavobacterium]OXB07375.1 hypothetical protein B0A81_11535 [Flavobacterium plurextorum]PIF59561.1 hypothetical protein CLU99_2793 [Flavobacterium sp. 2]